VYLLAEGEWLIMKHSLNVAKSNLLELRQRIIVKDTIINT